jgi:hypothetical protein
MLPLSVVHIGTSACQEHRHVRCFARVVNFFSFVGVFELQVNAHTSLGDWGRWAQCNAGKYVVAFLVKVAAASLGDDTAMNAVSAFCSVADWDTTDQWHQISVDNEGMHQQLPVVGTLDVCTNMNVCMYECSIVVVFQGSYWNGFLRHAFTLTGTFDS